MGMRGATGRLALHPHALSNLRRSEHGAADMIVIAGAGDGPNSLIARQAYDDVSVVDDTEGLGHEAVEPPHELVVPNLGCPEIVVEHLSLGEPHCHFCGEEGAEGSAKRMSRGADGPASPVLGFRLRCKRAKYSSNDASGHSKCSMLPTAGHEHHQKSRRQRKDRHGSKALALRFGARRKGGDTGRIRRMTRQS